MYLVVGSGPAGVACAQALLEKGADVTMLDVGLACEPDRAALVERLRAVEPEQWDAESKKLISAQQMLPLGGGAIPIKLVYGSAFPYAYEEALEQSGTNCLQSWAAGGLSNVWGAAMLPYHERDMLDWPFGPKALAPHYKAIARLTNLSGAHDALEQSFPFYQDPAPPLPASRQAEWILSRLERHSTALRDQGISFGRARLGVFGHDCKRCQLCLTGCVYDAIYRSNHTLARLQKNPRFNYASGARVQSCRESGSEAVVTYRETATGAIKTVSGTRVFVAAGVLSTTRILVRSLGLANAKLELQYHPYFLQPVVALKNAADVMNEKLHALAQVFVELADREVSEHTVHLQVYTYSPLIADRIKSLGPAAGLAEKLLLGRLGAIQGYLHSRDADPIEVHAVRNPSGEIELKLKGKLSESTHAIMRRARARLSALSTRIGLVPIPGMLQPGIPGSGNHIGGVFPMASSPQDMQSDLLGRTSGFSRIHAVDASVLPSLPATTITYSAMANAHRIASEAYYLDQPSMKQEPHA